MGDCQRRPGALASFGLADPFPNWPFPWTERFPCHAIVYTSTRSSHTLPSLSIAATEKSNEPRRLRGPWEARSSGSSSVLFLIAYLKFEP